MAAELAEMVHVDAQGPNEQQAAGTGIIAFGKEDKAVYV